MNEPIRKKIFCQAVIEHGDTVTIAHFTNLSKSGYLPDIMKLGCQNPQFSGGFFPLRVHEDIHFLSRKEVLNREDDIYSMLLDRLQANIRFFVVSAALFEKISILQNRL
jgi:hypothetical protein